MKPDTRFTILDANRTFHPVIRGMLRSMGYRKIATFVDGYEALDYLADSFCDLAFVDLAPADGDGLALISSLRHEELANPRMPIVALTSMTSKRNIAQAIAAGADFVLAKPVSIKVLETRIPAILANPLDYVHKASGYFGPDPARISVKNPPTQFLNSSALWSAKALVVANNDLAALEVDHASPSVVDTDADLIYLD
jgi:CheY-like chemotaxis protein